MKKLVLSQLTWFVLFSSSVFAVLPPYYQSSEEISKILADPKIANEIGSGRAIYSITKTPSGYTIKTLECTLEVEVKYLKPKQGFVGPAQYELIPGELQCEPKTDTQLEDRD